MSEPQILSSFTAEAITSLRGAIDRDSLSDTSKELLVRSQQYPTLRNLLNTKEQKQKIGEALIKSDPELLRNVLLGVFSESRMFERQEMTETPHGDPFTHEVHGNGTDVTTKDYISRISEIENTSGIVIGERGAAKRRQFAQSLTENFIKQSRRVITEDQRRAEAQRIEQGLSTPGWYNDKEQVVKVIRQNPLVGAVEQNVVEGVVGAAIAEVDRIAREQRGFETVLADVVSSVAADEVVLNRPDRFLRIAAAEIEKGGQTDHVIARASSLERAMVGFTDGGKDLPNKLSLLATTRTQKVVAAVVDILPEGMRTAIIAGITENAWEKAVDTATRFYGQQIVNEPWFQQALTSGNTGLANAKGALQSIISGPSKILGDVASAVFREPMNEATLAYIESARLSGPLSQPVTHKHFYAAAVYSQTPGILALRFNTGLQYGAGKTTQSLVKQGLKYMSPVFIGLTGSNRQRTGGALSGSVNSLISRTLNGGAIVGAGMNGLRGLTDKGVNFFKNLGNRTKRKHKTDIWIIVGCIALFVILFIVPTWNQNLINTSLATSTGGGIGEGPGINCQTTPDDPQCKFTPCVGDCRWPTSGYITQGPRTSQFCSASADPTHGTGSASSQNAIDFASLGGGAVYATKVGTIKRIYTGCPESGASIDPWCGGGPDPTNQGDGPHPEYAGYGNHIVLASDSGYTIIFGHLKSEIGVIYGQKITDPNTQIGWVDNSGHSFGTHLHWGVLSGGNILDLVPTGDPSLTPVMIDGCIQQTAGCTKICPVVPVKAGS